MLVSIGKSQCSNELQSPGAHAARHVGIIGQVSNVGKASGEATNQGGGKFRPETGGWHYT